MQESTFIRCKIIKQIFLSVLILFLFFGCASLTQITRENKHISLKGFTFTAPDTGEWYIKYPGFSNEQAVLTKQLGVSNITIFVAKSDIFDPQLRDNYASVVANKIRDNEWAIMMTKGVLQGLYTMQEYIKGEEEIDGRLFYTMDYVNIKPQARVRASLYLYFPSTYQNDFFIMTLFQEVTPKDTEIPDHKPVFIELLKSISLKKP